MRHGQDGFGGNESAQQRGEEGEVKAEGAATEAAALSNFH